MDRQVMEKITEFDILNILREINDPEIPLDIVSLGFIREIKVDEDNNLSIVATLTTQDCPMESYIVKSIINKLKDTFPALNEISIKFDFSNPWNTDFISSEGKEKLRSLGWKI
ncbi:MAG: metal-sulfur cluster assembly factor [Aquificae bacterium]|nr:metal-sulfur cluster assembly factor [Aquificota bacterium]